MPILYDFDYVKPGSIGEALEILARRQNCSILAGGTDLIDRMKEGAERPEAVIDIKGLDSAKEIALAGRSIRLGAGVTFSDVIASDLIRRNFPVMAEMARTVASVGIRNRATLAGNVCSAVPCMDSGPVLAASDASVITAGGEGGREIPAREWFLGNRKTALRKGEIVTGITIPLPLEPHAGCWVKLTRTAGEDLAQVNLLILALSDGTFRISFGAVAPVPVRARRIEELLAGRKIVPSLIREALRMINDEISPISDVRASKDYRMHMAGVMFERGLAAALARLEGHGPAYGTSVI